MDARKARETRFWVGLACLFVSTTVATFLVWAFAPLAVGWSPVVVTSGSMSPTIRPGDIVVAAPPSDDPRGVVVFEGANGGLVTHRVDAVLDDGRLRTKGDANAVPDSELLTHDRVMGEGRLLVPLTGLPTVWLRQGRPLEAVAVVVFVLVAAWGSRYALLARYDPWRSVPVGESHDGAIGGGEQVTGRHEGVGGLRRAAGAAAVLLVLCATLVGLSPTAAAFRAVTANPGNTWQALELVAPSGVSATFSCGLASIGRHITVEWTAVTEAGGYQVARSRTDGGPYTVVADVGASTTSYQDTDVALSTTYHYVVRTTASGWVSENSEQVSVTTPSVCLL